MSWRSYSVLLLLVAACATTEPNPKEHGTRTPRIANLQRAAALPWRDEGQCVVREASHPWPVVVERCFHALDSRKIQFRDTERRCPVASTDAATLETMVGICLLTQPELVVGAVIIVGAVVVAVAIKEELDAYERGRSHPEEEASSGKAKPVNDATPEEPLAERRPAPSSSPRGGDYFPPRPPDTEPQDGDPECTPRRVPPKGGHPFHNECADNVPFNAFRGANVLVNGKAFDALQPAARTLWEIKTTAIETYNSFVQDVELDKQVKEARRERALAAACGYDFRIGVRTEAHKELLARAAPDLEDIIVVMDWC